MPLPESRDLILYFSYKEGYIEYRSAVRKQAFRTCYMSNTASPTQIKRNFHFGCDKLDTGNFKLYRLTYFCSSDLIDTK